MDLSTYLPAVAQHGLITWGQALAAGLDAPEVARLVATGRWVRVRKGVYADGEAWAQLDPFAARPVLRIRAAHLVLGGSHVFSHDSAGIVLGLGCPDARTALVHVTRSGVTGGRIRAGIKQHGADFDEASVRMVRGLPVLPPARTALDIAREHGFAQGLAACDQALRSGASRGSFASELERMWCWPGVRAAKKAVESMDPGSESWTESLGRALVLDLDVGAPETQFGLRASGRTVWCDLRVGRHIFEIDGRTKYPDGAAGAEALWEEKKRQDFITGFKLGMSRITAHDCLAGRPAALRRLMREYLDTCHRFGTEIDDLAPYVVSGRSARTLPDM